MLNVENAGYNGIYLPECRLAMDGSHPEAKYTFITHAHSDHLPGNRQSTVWCTHPTYEFMQRRGFKGKAHIIEFGDTIVLESCRVSVYPAGHILGSAMFFVEKNQQSLFYTGDCRTPASPATEGFDRPDRTDFLVLDATFSLPIYRWKSHDELASELRDFAIQTLNESYTPVFLGYNLGKAQELLHLLAPLNHPMQIHGAGYKLCSIYEKESVDLGDYGAYDRESCEGKILVTTSSALNRGFASNIKIKRVAYCSGWAALESCRTQLNADKLIPISDHIDFFEMLKLCDSMNPQKVYIAHSPNPDVLKYYLEKKGIQAAVI